MQTGSSPATPPALAPLGTESLASRIADRLVDAIAGGVLVPGQRLIEAEIASALGVSRVPVREAMRLLEGQGILTATPRRGAVITGFDQARVQQICEARLALERLALRDAAAAFRTDPALRDGLAQMIALMCECDRRGEWLAAVKADLEFHRRIVAASRNPVVAMLWEALARHVLIVFGREMMSDRDAADLVEQHARLCDLLATGTAAALEREIEHHIMRLLPT